MNNNLRNLEKDLRTFAKRNKNVTYTKGLLMTFLITGTISLSTWGAVDTTQAARQGVYTAITDMRQTFSQARRENQKLLQGANLELIQLMEQGDQVVKSPWSSWQFGANGYVGNWRGSYKGHGDKKEDVIYGRESKFSKSSQTSRYSTSYGNTNLDEESLKEPKASIDMNIAINPRVISKDTINLPAKTISTPNVPGTVSFNPISPSIPVVTPTNINIKNITLSALWNGDNPTGTQYYQSGGTTPTIYGDGSTWSRTFNGNYTIPVGTVGAGSYSYFATPITRSKTFSKDEVLKTSQGIDYRIVYAGNYNPVNSINSNYTRGELRNFTYGGIFEFDNGNFTIDGLTLEVDDVYDSNGNRIIGTRAISTDGTSNLDVHNKSYIKLTSDGSVGFASDNNEGGTGLVRNMYNEELIYSTGKGNAAFILVKEQNNPAGTTYNHINEKLIIMDGDESQAFAFSSTSGIIAGSYKTTNVNNGEIVMDGSDSYGFALGTNRIYDTTNSWIDNSATGTISLLGDRNIGIVVQSAMDHANNAGTINIAGDSSVGMYSENNATTMKNTGTINITDYSKAFSSNNAGTKWLNNKIYANSDAEKSVGIRTGVTGATITNDGNINISTGSQNIGAFSSAGSVVNSGTGNITITDGDNIGMAIYGGTGTNAGTITATSDGSIGTISSGTGVMTNTGTITVAGGNSANGNGTVGVIAGAGSTNDNSTGTVTATVNGDKSIGAYSKGTLKLGNSTITATDGAINYFSDDTAGNIEIVAGTTSTATTGNGSLLFYNGANGTGTVNINGTLNATINNGGTAFYYTPNPTTATGSVATYNDTINYGDFGVTDIQNYFGTTYGGTLGKANLTMNPGSRLFVASNVKMNLTDTSINPATVTGAPNITGTAGVDYKTFMLYLSELTLDNNVNLDSPTDPYKALEISNSSIINQNTMSSNNANTVAMSQKNDETDRNYVTLLNDTTGTITLNGDNSIAEYATFGNVLNKGQITLAGKDSVALFGDENSKVLNEGTITLNGDKGTAMYYENKSTTRTTSEPMVNAGIINGTSNESSAMIYNPGTLDATAVGTTLVRNDGIITLAGDKNTGIYAKADSTKAGYTAQNNGIITLSGNSATIQNPNVGIYTDAPEVKIVNNTGASITTDDNTVGIFGYEVENSGDIKVGNGGVAIYSQGKDVTLNGGTITTGSNEAVGVYVAGSGQTVNANAGANFLLGDNSFGIVDGNKSTTTGNTINSNITNVNLGSKSVYTYSASPLSTINNYTNITSNTTSNGENYGLYSFGTVNNYRNINFENGDGNVGIYVTGANGKGINHSGATISVGKSDTLANKYAIGMTADNGATIENHGDINVTKGNGIGMYATGTGSKAKNYGNINLSGQNTIGMYLDDNAVGENYGTITTTPTSTADGIIGVYTLNNSVIKNYGNININATDGIGVYVANTANLEENAGSSISASGTDSERVYRATSNTSKTMGNVSITLPTPGSLIANVTRNGVAVTPTHVDTNVPVPTPNYVQAGATTIDLSTFNPIYTQNNGGVQEIGMYVDTSGVNYTNPISGLHHLTNLRRVNLIFGTEATQYTDAKDITIGNNILTPYKTAMATVSMANPAMKWNLSSGSLTWMATATQDPITSEIVNVYLSKVPYNTFAKAGDTQTYNFLTQLEQRYAVDSAERTIFDKLNDLGKGEGHIFAQAIDQMKGHQYSNIQQRINETGDTLDKEFDYLMTQWHNPSKQNNKLKLFGMRNEYNTDSAGIINNTSNAMGVAYVHEDETVKLGDKTGWYAGLVHNRYEFKDLGKSKENQTMLKVGVFKQEAFDDNGSLTWSIAGEGFAGYNDMTRRFWVVDDTFEAQGNYYSYGVGLKSEVAKKFRTSERTNIKPYASIDMEYGRFSGLKEDNGIMKLEVKSNDYYSIKPEVGIQFNYENPIAIKNRGMFNLGLGIAYENELGKIGNVNNRARLVGSNADYHVLRGEKDDRKGNIKTDLNLGIQNGRVGFTANLGYDTKGKNVRGGLGIRAIY